MKKKKIIIAVIAVVMVLAVTVGAVAAYVVKKASPYKKIVDAYNNTINADNFNLILKSDVEGFIGVGYCNLEVYGKGDSADDVIVSVFKKGGEHTLDNCSRMVTGDKIARIDSTVKDYSDIELLPIEKDYSALLKILKATAKRDVSAIYSDCLGLDKSTGVSYDEFYSIFFNTMLDYVSKNDDSSAIKNVNVSKDEFSMKVKPLELFEIMGDHSDFDYKKFATRLYSLDKWDQTKDLSWGELKKFFDDEDIYIKIYIKLNGKYIDTLQVSSTFFDKGDNGPEVDFINVKFDNVNQLTDKTSVGKQIMEHVK